MTTPLTTLTDSALVAEYIRRTPESARLYGRACRVLPSGITHDSRRLAPHPVFIERAQGARKWDADGNELVDFWGGHGALILGHGHPKVVEAVQAQLARGTHYGCEHELAVRWAEMVAEMVPSAERVRFTSSGTEATLLALRLARAFTGKSKVVRFLTHFHGWHDHLVAGYQSHFDGSAPAGVLPAIAEDVLQAAPDDPHDTAGLLEARDDIAALILEPTGSSWGRVPMHPEYLAELRAITAARGIVLIFDEVISGFRCAPGGAQEAYGVTPDLTTLAKIGAGGLPGGVVVGRSDILDLLDFEACRAAGREKVLHYGTFNGNPLSAAAAVATLEIVAETDACARANAAGARLRAGFNEALAEEGVSWAAYGTFSGFHFFTNPMGRAIDPLRFDPFEEDVIELRTTNAPLVNKLRLGLLVHGVDINGWPGGMVSAAHGEAEIEHALAAFRATLRAMRAEGDFD